MLPTVPGRRMMAPSAPNPLVAADAGTKNLCLAPFPLVAAQVEALAGARPKGRPGTYIVGLSPAGGRASGLSGRDQRLCTRGFPAGVADQGHDQGGVQGGDDTAAEHVGDRNSCAGAWVSCGRER